MPGEQTSQRRAGEGSPAYPRHWEADVLLRDGGTAHLRPISRDDRDRLVEFYAKVSDRSKYYRFFAARPTLSPREIQRYLGADQHNQVVLVLTIAEQIIAVGEFDRLPAKPGRGDVAEVAFLVQDRHQHRGIGQLLLEHLSQIGREVEVEKFLAEVLPENVGMMQVFREAGYQVAGGVEDGVMQLEFPIDATGTSLAVMQAREHRAETASVKRFFDARSVAVVGASRRHDTIGRLMVRNLVLGDFQGRVYVVNPAARAVAGMPAYPSVTDIPDEVDIAVVAVPAEAVPDVVLDCAHKGVHGIVVVSAGFAETGSEGRALQRRVLRLCRSYGLRLVGPNALGIINTHGDVSLNASLSTLMPPRGRAGFFCQSGALGVAILENVSRRGLGLSTFVSAGNRADVSGNDLLQYWEEDESTEVVLLYLESIGNPRKFSRIARRVSRLKPVIAVKSGRTTQGVPMGHAVRTSEAGQTAVDAMFRQAGVIQVDTLDEMFDVAQLVAHQPLPRGNRVAVVGNSDALGLMATDAAAAAGLEVRTTGSLGPEASADDFEKALDAAIDDPEVDAVLAVFIPPVSITGAEVANVLAVVGEQSDKPVLSSFLATQGIPELLRVPDVAGSTAGRGSVPSYGSPTAAVHALAKAVEYAAWRARPEPEIVAPRVADQVRARATVNRALASAPTGRTLRDEELTELLDAYGIELWPRVPVGSADEAVAAAERLGWDVVLKATAAHLRNRPDLAHVWRNIFTPEEMRQAWESMQPMGGTGGDGAVRTGGDGPGGDGPGAEPGGDGPGGDGPGGDGPGGEPGAQRVRTARLDADRLGADRLGAVGPGAVGPGAVGAGAETPGADERRADGARSGFVVQRNAPPGVPVAIKGVEDPLFGPVVSFGVSGAASELLGDRSYRIPPMDPLDAAEMVREIKAAPLLLGYRGSVPVDTRPVEELLLRLAQLKNDLPQVRELDLDLVVVGQEGAQVLTAAARVEPALEARSDWYVRRMAGQIGETTAG